MRRLARLSIALIFFLSGCYEGWDESQQQVPPELPQTPTPKAIAYLLLQPIQFDAGAMADPDCFPKVGLREFRTTEWSMRLAAAQDALVKLADVLVTNPVSIGRADCAKLDGVTRAATSQAPWGDGSAPTDDPLGRAVVHLTLAFSEEEPAITPAAAVTANPWSAFQKLAARGIRVVSLRSFDVSNGGAGYYTDWRTALATADKRDATPIDDVDPTEAGKAAREARIEVDTEDLAAWVLESAQ
jgi:hypothetical protein